MFSKFPIYILGMISRHDGRFIDPHWRMEVDFTLLADGGHPSASLFTETVSQGTNSGFTFSRSTESTVQIAGDGAAQPVISGIPANAACVGSLDGVKRGLVLQPQRISGAYSDLAPGYSGARHIYAHGDVTSIYNPSFSHSSSNPDESAWTNDAATGPDGTAHAIAISSTAGVFQNPGTCGTYAPWHELDIFFNIELNMNAWYKGTGTIHQIWQGRKPWDNFDVINLIETITVASGNWQRLSCVRTTGTSQFAGVLAYGPDITAFGSGVAGCTYNGLVDFIQFSHDRWPAECIDAIDGIRAGDRLSYPAGLNSFTNGQRLRLYMSFYPKFSTSEECTASVVINSDASVQDLTLFSSGSDATRVWGAIEFDGSNTLGNVKIHDAENTLAISTEVVSWSRYDLVEIMLEAGGGGPTTFKYRKNSGSWIDFTSLNATVLNTMGPSGTVYFGCNGADDINTTACWLKEIRAYDLTGGPT